jgi:HSP20 family molecular chaperone IbpA
MLTQEYWDDVIFNMFDPFNRTKLTNRSNVHGHIRSKIVDDMLELSIDLPGVEKEDVDISFEPSNYLKIQAKRKDLDQTSTYRYQLASSWNQRDASAEIKNGVLHLKIPKSENSKSFKLLVK